MCEGPLHFGEVVQRFIVGCEVSSNIVMNVKVEGQKIFDNMKYSLPKLNINETPFPCIDLILIFNNTSEQKVR